MIDSLYSIVRRVLEPQYPWIKDFVWVYHYDADSIYYTLEIEADRDFYFKNPDYYEMTKKLFNDVEMLFRMAGPTEYEFLSNVIINPED